MKLNFNELQALPVGARITINTGEMIGDWVHLELDHTGQINPGLQGDLRPYWANANTGQVRHFSWLADSHIEPDGRCEHCGTPSLQGKHAWGFRICKNYIRPDTP